MTSKEFIKLLFRNFKWILIGSLVLTASSILLTSGQKKQYTSHTLLNTGLISGYNIESQQGSRVDYAYTNNEIENLINLASTTETHKELSLKLLAQCIRNSKNEKLELLPENLEEILELLNRLEVPEEILGSDEKIYQFLRRAFEEDRESLVYELLYSKHLLFGLRALSGIKVEREGNSDMIKMEYTSIDPFFSKNTLVLLTEIFLRKHKEIKEGQTESVIEFFEKAARNSEEKLNNAENSLLTFSVSNQIINYYEQTRFIAGNKEELDKKYNEEIKIYSAADSVINRLEEKLENQGLITLLQEELFHNNNELAEINTELAVLNLIDNKQNESDNLRLMNLNARRFKLEEEINSSASSLISIKTTKDGIQSRDILQQWLSNYIQKSEAGAKLEAMKQMRNDYKELYKKFAPLGSTLKRLEREIDVAEREYLENLHSYNQARLHKYNMLMSSNLKVIDPPFFPEIPEKSKRILLIVLSMILGAFIPLVVLVASELLDNSLKNPVKAEEITSMKVAAALPLIRKDLSDKIDLPGIENSILNLFIQNLNLGERTSGRQFRMAVLSNYKSEGKSFVIGKLKSAFIEAGYKVDTASVFEKYQSDSEIIIYEFPSILQGNFPMSWLKQMDANILVSNAKRNWTVADEKALELVQKHISEKLQLFLNGLDLDEMESLIGEIPRKRSKIRKVFKSLLLGQTKVEISVSK